MARVGKDDEVVFEDVLTGKAMPTSLTPTTAQLSKEGAVTH